MKKLSKVICLAVAALTLCLCLSACGGGASSSGAIANTYNTIRVSLIEEMGWYTDELYSLQLNDNDTYTLFFNTNRFGGEDFDMRGIRTITYSGKYTSAPSADGEPTHLDISLEVPTQITWEQHGKGFSRVQTLPGVFFINTSDWTDAMTAAYDPAGSAKTAKDFLAEFGKALTVTVEEPSLAPDDTTLTCRIVTIPDLGILYE